VAGRDPVNAAWALPQSAAREHRFGLDVARAAAILLVFATHGQNYWSPLAGRYASYVPTIGGVAGEHGIALFFALSGFLIGGLLLDVQQRGPTPRAIGIFVVRRWMRTLPLYYLVMVALLLVPALEPATRERLLSYFLLVQNFATPMPAPNWFGISWSLTIEEWSYVVLPLAAFLLCRRTREPIACVALILIACGIAVRIAIGLSATPWQLADWDLLIRKMVVSRMDAIAYGVLAAVWVRRCGRLPALTLAVSLLLIAWSAWTCTQPLVLAGPVGWSTFFPLSGIGFALLVPWLAELRRPPLIAPPVHFVARISYSLYLVHWSFMFVAAGVAPRWQLVVYVCGSIITATVLTYAIELPIMRLRPSQERHSGPLPVAPRPETIMS
jgi:peptidoglycan/LPS O-acetylase OafA/YrhL